MSEQPTETPVSEQGTPTPATPSVSTTPCAQSTESAIEGGALIDIEDFARVKLRVAVIEQVEKVEKSKKLYKLQIDLGPAGKRQIVSGIAQFYTPEQLLNRRIVVVANLKPAKLMGVESHGMLLAASSPDRSALTLLAPSEEIPVGSEIS